MLTHLSDDLQSIGHVVSLKIHLLILLEFLVVKKAPGRMKGLFLPALRSTFHVVS